jgi:hypothetical protein
MAGDRAVIDYSEPAAVSLMAWAAAACSVVGGPVAAPWCASRILMHWAYLELASGRNGPIGSFWMASLAGSMSNATMKPEFASTISCCGFADFGPDTIVFDFHFHRR